MRLVYRAEGPADPVGELVSAEQSLGLDYLAFAVDPLGLYRIEPRTLGRQKAGNYPYSSFATIIFDLAVVGGDPTSHLVAFMPGSVVPDQKQGLLAPLFELLATPPKKLRGYGAHRPTIDEPQPGLFKFGQIHPVAGEGLRLGVILSRLLLQEMHRLCGIRPRAQARSLKAGEPALVFESQSPLWMGFGESYHPISSSFFRAYSGSGLSIQRLALSQRTPSLASVARMVSPLTCLSVMPCSKLTSAAYSKVQKVSSLPKFRGSWWSNSRRASLRSSSKARWVCFGREEPATRASKPRLLKSWMASRTVWEPQPSERDIREARSPLWLARMIWARRMTKASEERSALSSCSFSVSDGERTKIGGLMPATIASLTTPVLGVH